MNNNVNYVVDNLKKDMDTKFGIINSKLMDVYTRNKELQQKNDLTPIVRGLDLIFKELTDKNGGSPKKIREVTRSPSPRDFDNVSQKSAKS